MSKSIHKISLHQTLLKSSLIFMYQTLGKVKNSSKKNTLKSGQKIYALSQYSGAPTTL